MWKRSSARGWCSHVRRISWAPCDFLSLLSVTLSLIECNTCNTYNHTHSSSDWRRQGGIRGIREAPAAAVAGAYFVSMNVNYSYNYRKLWTLRSYLGTMWSDVIVCTSSRSETWQACPQSTVHEKGLPRKMRNHIQVVPVQVVRVCMHL